MTLKFPELLSHVLLSFSSFYRINPGGILKAVVFVRYRVLFRMAPFSESLFSPLILNIFFNFNGRICFSINTFLYSYLPSCLFEKVN